MAAFGPLVGSSPGLAPRVASALAILLFPAAAVLFCPCFRAVAARAVSLFFDGPFGFLTEGILILLAEVEYRGQVWLWKGRKKRIKVLLSG